MQGKFISFEGIDGSGKSTQLRLLAKELRSRNVDVLTTRQPGGTLLGQKLREAFLETEEKVAPIAELFLFAADRAQHVEYLIKPALAKNQVVICDRYADATVAYQGAGRGFERKTVEQVIELATGGLKPDLTLFFDISVDTAVARTRDRNPTEAMANRMDFESGEFYERVRCAYLEISSREQQRFRVVDAEGGIDAIHARVLSLVLPEIAHAEVSQ